MCLATPAKVITIKKDWARVKSGDHIHRVNLGLLKNVKKGDYLIAHGELAINRLNKKEAEKIIKLIENYQTDQ